MPINKTGYYWIIFALIFFAVVSRIIPHPPNFTPIGAIGLFAGCYLTTRRFWLVPLIALLISDYFIGFYHAFAMVSVYASFLISALMGHYLLHKKVSALRVGGVAFLSATQFFIITNMGVWMTGILYPLNVAGLVECYIMAIPFYGNTLVGDLFYCAMLFGCFSLCTQFFDDKKGSVTSQI